MSMGVLTFISMIVTGSVFSLGLMQLFRRKPVLGVALVVLAVICYVAYYMIASRYYS